MKPRNTALLALLGLLVGVPSIMLWLGRWKLALVYFAASMVLTILLLLLPHMGAPDLLHFISRDFSVALSVMLLPIGLLGIVHAVKIKSAPLPLPWYAHWPVALVAPVVLMVLAALAFRSFVYQPFNIPSESSLPSLMVGDHIMVSKITYRSRDPERGDIAVFKLPRDPSIDYIKRVVGLPGDRIQMVGGVLVINGEAVKLEPVELPDVFKTSPEMKFFRETLPGGRSYIVADMGETSADNTEEYTVPEGQYFTLGDNRDNSQDSRFLEAMGYIPREKFVGPYAFRYWNSEGLPLINGPVETASSK